MTTNSHFIGLFLVEMKGTGKNTAMCNVILIDIHIAQGICRLITSSFSPYKYGFILTGTNPIKLFNN
jgi:hypothetical protein